MLEREPGMVDKHEGRELGGNVPPGKFWRVMLRLLLDMIFLEKIQKKDRVLDHSCL